MTLPAKITVIGAGSASFGENTLSALLRSKKLSGSTLALVDRNPRSLEIVQRLAERLNREWDAGFTINGYTHHAEALPGSNFVVNATEVGPREELWKSDFEIPLKYGVRQPYAENGGPGGFAHAARNVKPVLEIARAMEQACPDAWFINFTNPMVRIVDLVNRYSAIKVVGLCHQIFAGYTMVGLALAKDMGFEIPEGITGMHADPTQYSLREIVKRQAVQRLDIRAAGTNHFTWILSICDRQTGEDLYPIFRQRWQALPADFEPLTRDVYDAFGIFPVPGDTHLCEYLPWVSDPQTKPWQRYNIRLYDWDLFASLRDFSLNRLEGMAEGVMPIDGLLETDSEGALEMIENIAGAGNHYHLAANLPNVGQISNLPHNTIVETPIIVDGAGIHPVHMGRLPEPVAELCRRELQTAQLGIDAAVEGDRQKALQCLLLDPVIRDIETAKLILDDYLTAYREHLPQFWQ
ncbi:MAG: alpha-glucosidase/alpha-galactosidase [Anaerolineales bacterium]